MPITHVENAFLCKNETCHKKVKSNDKIDYIRAIFI